MDSKNKSEATPKFIETTDKGLLDLLKTGLKKKNGHCPCMVAQNEDTICPCKKYRETAHCCCGRYIE